MPKYYFDVNGRGITSANDEAHDLPNDAAAWHEATLVAGEAFKDVGGAFKPGQEWKLEVLNEHHRAIYAIVIRGDVLSGHETKNS